MDLNARHRIEEEFHDAKAITGVEDFYGYGALATANEFSWRSLGDLRGKDVLEIGCGEGETTLRFARAGARVTCIDISSEMIKLVQDRARAENLGGSVHAEQMSGEAVAFPEHSFDLVYGHSILHHLDINIAAERIFHVLRPGGIAVFLEPLDYNPVIRLFRLVTPQRRTPTEKPLRYDQIEHLAGRFTSWKHREFYLFSLIAFVWYYIIRSRNLFSRTMHFLEGIDAKIFQWVPVLRRFAWVTVLTLEK